MILEQLRSGTADLHASLEAALPLGGGAELTQEDYVRVLQGFRGFFAGWEQQARQTAHARFQPLLRQRARTQLLDNDLLALGGEIPEPASAGLPAMEVPAALLGSMYVLEGSRLGGQYLVRDLEARLGLTPQHGLSFFYGFGPRTGSRWKEFCQVLVDEVTPAMAEAAVHAARETFIAFEDWMLARRPAGATHLPLVASVE